MSDSTTSFRLSEKIKKMGELLIKRHPHTLSHPKIYYEGILVLVQKLNEKGENFPGEPFDDLISDHEKEKEELDKEIEILKSLKEKQRYQKKSPTPNVSASVTKTGYHQEMRDGLLINVEDFDD